MNDNVEVEVAQSNAIDMAKQRQDYIEFAAPGNGVDVHAVVERDEAHRIKRGLGFFPLVGLAFMIYNSWAAVAGTLAIGLAQGGSVTLLYGYILVTILVGCVAASAAELSSVYPTAGGQYHWSSVLASKSTRRGLGYLTGFINLAAWIIAQSSVCLIIAQAAVGLAVFRHPDYVPKSWHLFLVYQTVNVIFAFWVGYGLHRVRFIFQAGLMWSLTLFLVTIICLLAGPGSRGHYNRSSDVWGTFTNEVGWTSNAVVFLTGLANPNYGYLGLDGAIHMAEDCLNPVRDVPRTLMVAVLVGFITGFAWLVAAFYSIHDLAAVATSVTGFPYIEMFNQSLRNDAAVVFVTFLYITNAGFGLTGCMEAASRLAWSFAMDDALVGSKYLSRLNLKHNASLYALLFNGFFTFFVGCLYLASSTVYNAVIGCGLILSYSSFAIPVVLLMYNRRRFDVRPPFALGPLGWVFNVLTVLFACLITIFYCFPAVQPVTSSNMNYSSVVLVIIAILGALNWVIWARKHFVLPKFVLEAEGQKANLEAM